MRLTGSRAYARPTPTPRMPPGLVELMEGLTKDVLKNNPDDIYEFCAGHMEKLLNLRKAAHPTKQQKIKNAQEKIRQKIKERHLQYDKEMSELSNKTNEQKESLTKLDNTPSMKIASSDSSRPPVHQEEVVMNNEVEISHEPNVTVKRTDISDVEQNRQPEVGDVVPHTANMSEEPSNDAKEELKSSTSEIILVSRVNFQSEELSTNVEEKIKDEDAPSTVENKEIIKDLDNNQGAPITIENKEITNDLHENLKENMTDITPVASESIRSEESGNDVHHVVTGNTVDITPVTLATAADNTSTKEVEIQINENPIKPEIQQTEVSTNDIKEEKKSADELKPVTSGEISKEQKDGNEIDVDTKGNLMEVPNKALRADMLKESKDKVTDNGMDPSSEMKLIDNTDCLKMSESVPQAPQHENISMNSMKISDSLDSVVDNVKSKDEREDFAADTNSIKEEENKNISANENVAINSNHQEENLPPGVINNEMQIDTQVTYEIETVEGKKYGNPDELKSLPANFFDSENNYDNKSKVDSKVIHPESVENTNEAVLVLPLENRQKDLNDSKQETSQTGLILADVENPESYSNQLVKSESIESVAIHDDYKDTTQLNDFGHDHQHFVDENNISQIDGSDDFSEQSGILSNELFVKENVIQDNQSGTTVAQNAEPVVSGMDLETAAVTIQKVFRTFLFSKSRASTLDDSVNQNSLDEDVEKENDEPEYIVSTTNLNKERRTLGISRMDTVLQTVNEEKSLSLSTDDSSTLSSAVTTIQAHVRGFLVRNRLASYKTSSNSLVNSEGPSTISLDGETPEPKKTILNIHIVPERGQFMSRDESMLTSIDLPLDNSPPSSINLHPLGYDKSEPRKQLKREDAIQSISPPSNNSGKLSEEVDSVKDILENSMELKQESEVSTVSLTSNDKHQDVDAESCDTTLTISSAADTVVDADVYNATESSPEHHSEVDLKNKEDTTNLSSDEMDVVTPFPAIIDKTASSQETESSEKSKLLHSGEFHDMVVQTQVKRNESSVVREFKNVLVYFLLWDKT